MLRFLARRLRRLLAPWRSEVEEEPFGPRHAPWRDGVHGRWYQVELNAWNLELNVEELSLWAERNLKHRYTNLVMPMALQEGQTMDDRSVKRPIVFYFEDKEDATLFKLFFA